MTNEQTKKLIISIAEKNKRDISNELERLTDSDFVTLTDLVNSRLNYFSQIAFEHNDRFYSLFVLSGIKSETDLFTSDIITIYDTSEMTVASSLMSFWFNNLNNNLVNLAKKIAAIDTDFQYINYFFKSIDSYNKDYLIELAKEYLEN